MTNQCLLIYNHMKFNGPITAKKAADLYGVQRLAARINDLKNLGVNIKSQLVTGVNRYGEKTRFKEYWLA